MPRPLKKRNNSLDQLLTLHSLAVISGYTLIFVRPNVVKDDLRRKIIELLLHLHIVLH